MDTLSGFAFISNYNSSPYTRFFPLTRLQRPPLSRRTPTVFVLKTSPGSVSESVEGNIREMFFKDREVNGDFISKVSDVLWQREVLKVVDTDASKPVDTTQQSEPVLRDDSERRKKLNFLEYEALKRELTLLSVGIGTACGGYCLIVISLQFNYKSPKIQSHGAIVTPYCRFRNMEDIKVVLTFTNELEDFKATYFRHFLEFHS